MLRQAHRSQSAGFCLDSTPYIHSNAISCFVVAHLCALCSVGTQLAVNQPATQKQRDDGKTQRCLVSV